MKTSTINVSFKDDLLTQIDRIANAEARSRSDLIREAARMYLERKKRWKSIFAFGKQQSSKLGLKKSDVAKEIERSRK
jgi:metal-responsive CopG/Arc/MetJ family transcriptional regulator